MFCPQCLIEYRDGFTECTDCQVPLVAGLPPEPGSPHAFELVTVLEVSDSLALRLAKSALDEADIGYLVSGDQARYLAGIPGAYGIGEVALMKFHSVIQVSREDAAEARELLEPLGNPDPAPPAE